MSSIFTRRYLPWWLDILATAAVVCPVSLVLAGIKETWDNCKCEFCTKFAEGHKIYLRESREAGKEIHSMPAGCYKVEYTTAAAPESLGDKKIRVEFDAAFRKVRYDWPGEGKDT
ncbi:hypothetical protein TWF718_009929 [Orbilia javanica]|uniref:Uncharacterized protein n=1 Tax=Orbilia javanica TaxID=47235 RepID=A0AAN8MN60_9PEZI